MMRKRRNTAQQVVPYTLRVYLEMGSCCAESRQHPGGWHPLLLVPKRYLGYSTRRRADISVGILSVHSPDMPGHISSPNPGSGSDGCFAALSEILDEEGGAGAWGSGATRRDKVILRWNALTEVCEVVAPRTEKVDRLHPVIRRII